MIDNHKCNRQEMESLELEAKEKEEELVKFQDELSLYMKEKIEQVESKGAADIAKNMDEIGELMI